MMRSNRAPAPCANTQAAPLAAGWPWLTCQPSSDMPGPAVRGELGADGIPADHYYGR
jgi:hypothetical protein